MSTPALDAQPPVLSTRTIGCSEEELEPQLRQSALKRDEQFLLQAFRSFATAAQSLEHSYADLTAEVGRLRRELEKSNTDLQSSLEENRAIRASLDRLLSSLPCGVLVISAQGEISRTNPEARRLLAMGDGGDKTETYVLSDKIRQLLELAGRSPAEQVLHVASRAQSLWIAAKHACLPRESDGESVFILRDVTEQKRIEEQEMRMGRERALAEMSAILAHEMRNPLGSLELFAGLLADANLDADARQWVEQVQTGLRMMAATVNNVLHFHSLPAPQRSLIDMGSVVDWARGFLLPLTRRAHLALSLENQLAGIVVSADRHRVEQVLLNLVLNAIRVTPEGGWIEIRGERCGLNTIRLIVSDNGPGISPEVLPRLFQAGASTSGHSGMGLAVCRKIVEQHGGSITAENRPAQGARFVITLPIHPVPHSPGTGWSTTDSFNILSRQETAL